MLQANVYQYPSTKVTTKHSESHNNGHRDSISTLTKSKRSDEINRISYILPVIRREGYNCAAQSNICIVHLPRGSKISVHADSVNDVTLHPKLNALEVLLAPVVCILPNNPVILSSDKQAVIELLKTAELHDREIKPIPMFSNIHPSQPPQWRDLNPDDIEILRDRIVFNTRHFGLFTVVARLPTPSRSITITPSELDTVSVEITLPEVSNLKIEIPPNSVKSESEMSLKVTAHFDHPKLCDKSVDATACITLEPHGLQFKEKIPIRMEIPGYAQITDTYSDAKLQFLHSTDPTSSSSVTWEDVPEDEYEIIKEGDEYVGIMYSTQFSNRKAIWRNIPKKILKAAIQGPIHEFRKFIARMLLKRFSGRCQVFMSRETVVGNYLTFSIAAVLCPLQECHQILKNYEYELCDSEQTPVVVKGSSIKLTVELDDDYEAVCKKFCEEVELSGEFQARADFKIKLDSNATIVDEAVLGDFTVEYGGIKAHRMNLIKKKAPVVTVKEHESSITVRLPSLDSTDMLNSSHMKEVLTSLWPARFKWRTIGTVLGIDNSTLETIKSDHHRTDDHIREMIYEWLKSVTPIPCWKNLTTALKSLGIIVKSESDAPANLCHDSNAQLEVSPEPRRLPRKEDRVSSLQTMKPPKPLPKKTKAATSKPDPHLLERASIYQLNTLLNQWSEKISKCTQQMAVYINDQGKNVRQHGNFAVLAADIMRDSKELTEIGKEVAESCTNEKLKKALRDDNLPKIDTITKQFKVLMRSSDKEHLEGDAPMVSVENLLSAVRNVVEDIRVATIEVKDSSVQDSLRLRWGKQDMND